MIVRRVVTGHTPEGKAVVSSDTEVDQEEWFNYLWRTDHIPTFPDDGAPSPAPDFFPPLYGIRFGIFTLPPDTTAGMHISDTIDFEYIISGEMWLELDDGVEILLKPGDTVVQNGTIHAWHNRGSEPCRLVYWMTGAHRKQDTA